MLGNGIEQKRREFGLGIDGLRVEFEKNGSRKYAKLVHILTGKRVAGWSQKPIECSQKEFCKRLRQTILPFEIDWNQTEEAIIEWIRSDVGKEKWHDFLVSLAEISLEKFDPEPYAGFD